MGDVMKTSVWAKKIGVTLLSALLLCCVGWGVWHYKEQNYQLKSDKNPAAEVSRIDVPQPSLEPQPVYVCYNSSVANVAKINRNVNQGVIMYPAVKGNWQWTSDSCLQFLPEVSLVPDTTYKVELKPEVFSPHSKVKDVKFSFAAPAFSGKVLRSEFYENPQSGGKAVTASFEFNYPLYTQDIKDKVKITTVGGESYDFTYNLDENNTVLHVVSAPIKLGVAEDFAKITVDGAENVYNKKALKEKIVAEVKIPSSSAFFQIKSVKSTIVHNKAHNDDAEQIAVVDFSTAVFAKDLVSKFHLYYLEQDCSQARQLLATAHNQPEKISALKKLEIMPFDREEKSATHMFKYDVNKPAGCLVAKVDKGLRSAEGYVLANNLVTTVWFSPYPQEVNIMSSGAILPLSNKHEIGFVSRGVNEINITVARINEDNLNHLATQTNGDFASPYFINYNFDENNMAEIFTKKLNINTTHPEAANYSSLDLNEYLADKKGVFLIKARGKSEYDTFSREDVRLVIMTDLGIVVKDDVNGTHNVFVADVAQGKPVAGAKVEVLGKNGLPILSSVTNEQGLAVIADFANFENDKEAVVYKVSKGNDLSFLPINKYDRRLNLSRFEVGGEYDMKQGDFELKGEIFSDRGIYRPGETAYFGIIVRQNDLAVPQQLPLVLEINNPNGDIVANYELKTANYGFMSYEYKVPEGAVTGIYRVNMYVKNANNERFYITEAPFKVDEFLPDNLRIKAQWQDVAERGWSDAKSVKAEVLLQNLYGTPAVDHEIKASYVLTPTLFRFKEYSGYVFLSPQLKDGDVRKSFNGELPLQKTDEKGKALVDVDVAQFEHGPYELRLFIEGLEKEGGRGVKTSVGALIYENSFLVGWKADGDLGYVAKGAKRSIDFVALDNKLTAINKNDLVLRLMRREMVSNLVLMPNGTYEYKMMPKESEISQQNWQISAQHTTEFVPTDEAGDFVWRIEDKNGTLVAKVEWSVAGNSNNVGLLDKNANMNLKLNHDTYVAGSEIEMQISAPYAGYGLITIERDSVYAYKWFKTDQLTTIQKIQLPENVEGNAYVNVAFFRDIQSPEIFMAPMSYAAVPFNISKSKRQLDIELEVPQKVKSGTDLVIKYKTPEEAKIVIYGVNQGILQVARYKYPDPLAVFLPKKALRVITAQIMDLIMPDLRLLRNLSASGGDDSYDALALNQNLNPFARKNDKPVAFWSGIIDADSSQREYRYAVPDNFNGEIKVMAVAVSAERLGHNEKAVTAHGDFALIPSGPLNVAPGDEFVMAVNVGNMVENSGDDYPVEIEVNTTDGLQLLSDKKQVLSLNEKAEGTAKYKLKALPKLGNQEIVFVARSLKDSTKKSQVVGTLSVRPAAPYGSNFILGHERAEFVLKGKKIENLYDEYRLQQIAASPSPMVLAGGLLQYLDKFPHFCTEQTVSKVFAAIEVFFKYPELVESVDVYALFDDAMVKLQERQTMDGGFSAWNVAGMEADPYASVYATHFLLKAAEHNFNVPQGMLQKALDYCRNQAARHPDNINDFVPAYATYVLTLNGTITTNYLLNLEEFYKEKYAKNWQESLSASLMAASYKLLQDNKKAESLADMYKNGENVADNALNSYLIAEHFPEIFAEIKANQVQFLLQQLANGNWTTASAAWATLALNALDANNNKQEILFNGQKAEQQKPFPRVDFTPQSKSVTVSSNKPFYYTVSQLGFAKDEHIRAKAEGMEVEKTIYDKNGEPVNTAKTGDELTVVINYRSLQQEAINDVAIVDLLAGSFEVVENSLQQNWTVDSAEVREDRVIAYVAATNQSATISYKVKVIADGSFVVPAVYAAALYQPLVRANSDMSELSIGE